LKSNRKKKSRSLDDVFWSILVPLFIDREKLKNYKKKRKVVSQNLVEKFVRKGERQS